MSGPVGAVDADPTAAQAPALEPVLEIRESRTASVGGSQVRRALPQRGRRTVGAWCFVDHFGPEEAAGGPGMQVGPHPHIGLQTVTWLLEGEVVHRDSLGSEQLIAPGALNLMTAGQGVVHSEESPPGRSSGMHGIQLWVAQPEETRFGAPAFEHHRELPAVELGSATGTVIVGSFGGATSPARTDTPLVGVDVALHDGAVAVPLDRSFEYALVPVEGSVGVDDETVRPGSLAYLGGGRDELSVSGDGRFLLLGGVPFGERLLMFWNFVGRTRAEIDDAYEDWAAGRERFGPVATTLPRIESPRPPWSTGRSEP